MEDQICEIGGDLDRELNPEVAARRNALFEKYVTPYYNMIYMLCKQYSNSPANVEENYTIVLTTLFRGIETYDPNREIKTWLHICTKRQVFELERKRAKLEAQKDCSCDIDDIATMYLDAEEHVSAAAMDVNNYREFYNDDILAVLDEMNPIHKDAFIYQQAGYSLKEIADIEYKKGTLKSRNIETVKSRLFLARQILKKNLTRDGKRKID